MGYALAATELQRHQRSGKDCLTGQRCTLRELSKAHPQTGGLAQRAAPARPTLGGAARQYHPDASTPTLHPLARGLPMNSRR